MLNSKMEGTTVVALDVSRVFKLRRPKSHRGTFVGSIHSTAGRQLWLLPASGWAMELWSKCWSGWDKINDPL